MICRRSGIQKPYEKVVAMMKANFPFTTPVFVVFLPGAKKAYHSNRYLMGRSKNQAANLFS
jgi:hypothetical protein